eukprot:1395265-Pleurochrysis_carterae.AAC.1
MAAVFGVVVAASGGQLRLMLVLSERLADKSIAFFIASWSSWTREPRCKRRTSFDQDDSTAVAK